MEIVGESIKMFVKDQERRIGTIHINPGAYSIGEYTRPFLHQTEKLTWEEKSNLPYEALNAYIIAALNDYYKKIEEVKETNEKEKRIRTYQRLYNLWVNLNNEKRKGNKKEADAYYRDLRYELHVLGYPFGV